MLARLLSRKRLGLATALAAMAAAAHAQNFNVDLGTGNPAPIDPYPGAAFQPGHWNPVDATTPGTLLFNTSSAATPVSIAVAGGVGNFLFDFPGTGGDTEKLYDDFLDVGGLGASAVYTFTGLLPGLYEVYTYAWNPVDPFAVTAVSALCASDPTVEVGGFWPGGHALGVTYAGHRVQVTSGFLAIEAVTVAGFGAVNGFQLKKLSASGAGICFGDGTDTDCPCDNSGSPGHGCENSFGTGGGLLSAFGTPDVSADTLVLSAAFLSPSTTCVFFQGTVLPTTGGEPGAPFGDGLLCASGTVIRLAGKFTSCGLAAYPGPSGADISAAGMIPAAGGLRYYQVMYRNTAAAFCPSAGFNLTNGVEIMWLP